MTPWGWLLLAVLTAVWFTAPGLRPLLNPDEGRYAEIPREMLATGEWITPHLNGLPYLEKPPLQYWATALAYEVFGQSEGSARLWTALTAYGALLMVFLLGRRLGNATTGIVAVAVLASGGLFAVMGQTLTLDMSFSALLTGMLATFCLAQLERLSGNVTRSSDSSFGTTVPDGVSLRRTLRDDTSPSGGGGRARRARGWMLTAWIFLALAVLTKGIAALAITGGVLVLYSLLQRDWALWRSLHLISGAVVFALLVLPWFVLVSRDNPDFLQFFFIHEHLQRFLTMSADRYQPAWYFLAVLAIAILPWGWQCGVALARGWRRTQPLGMFDPVRLLWVWAVFVVFFFSISDSKLPPYILPAMPALALLAALEATAWGRGALLSSIAPAAAAAAGIAAVASSATHWVAPEVLGAIPHWRAYIWTAAAVLAGGATTAAILRSNDSVSVSAVVSVSAGWTLALLSLLAGWGSSDMLRTGKALARVLPAELVRTGPVYSVETYDQTLPFYLQRTLTLVNYRNELDYGLRHFPAQGIDATAQFADHWRLLDRGAAIMTLETYHRLQRQGLPMHVLGSDLRRVAVSRR